MDSIVSNEDAVKMIDEDTNTSLGMEMKMTNVEAMDICEEDIKGPGTPPLLPSRIDESPDKADALWRSAALLCDYHLEDGHLIEGEYVQNVQIGNHGSSSVKSRGGRLQVPIKNLEITGTFRFLDLPGELRNNVYKHLVIFKKNVNLTATPPAITHVSRQLRRESLSIFYGSNGFVFRDYTIPQVELCVKLKDTVQFIGKRYINLIRSLEIPVGDCSNHGESSFYCKMKSFPYAEVTLEWQHNCGSSKDVRRYTINRLREKIQKRRLSGDMHYTVNCGSINISRLFNMFDKEGIEHGSIWSYHLF